PLVKLTKRRGRDNETSTGLAALGIGERALALGAQKTIENFVGSLTLVVDQPVRAGDFCQFGGMLGTVEDIGMRSTRIRTLDRTPVTVPNGKFSAMKIENFTRRDRFGFHHEFGLRYEATPNQMRQFLAALRTMFSVDTRLETESHRVRFLGYGADALPVEIFAYVFARDWNHFLEIQEELALQIMDIVAGSEVNRKESLCVTTTSVRKRKLRSPEPASNQNIVADPRTERLHPSAANPRSSPATRSSSPS
ncbi:mechanosensitive ion channel family protein, partial [Aurantimonas sp. C2-5-R2]|uniref:mechanosensitive ion channel family protein n=1 Tax=Aurantimonas sp. C2-5-R2 TaxID=3113713 RepID=UPI002F95B71E